MNLSKSQDVFLETTIFFRRLLGSKVQRRSISKALKGHQRLSSTYIQAEYYNAAFRSATQMYNLLCDTTSIEDAVAEWNKQRGEHYRRGIEMLLLAVCRRNADRYETIDELAYFIEEAIGEVFKTNVDVLFDETSSSQFVRLPQIVEGRYVWDISFPPPVAPKSLQVFLSENTERLKLIHDYLSEERKQMETIVRDIDRILAGEFNLGIRAWQRLGDVIIALEVPENCALFTTNRQHFEPLCRVLGIPLFPF